MASLNDKIAELESEIKAIKNANPGWAIDSSLIAAIAAKDNRIAGLEARLAPGKSSAIFLLISPFV